MDMADSVGIDCGSGGWAGKMRAKGENWNNCNKITITDFLKRKYKSVFTK